MFSAATVLISGNAVSGLIMLIIMAFFASSYIALTRSVSGYPTNLCIVGCILCAIVVDVIWGLFNFGENPLLGVPGNSPSLSKLFFEFMAAGVVFFSGLIITNIIKIKRRTALKTVLFILFAAVMAALLVNLVSIRSVSFKLIFPGLSLTGTNIALICAATVIVCVLGAIAISGRAVDPKINVATAAVLAVITLCAGAAGIYKIGRAHV